MMTARFILPLLAVWLLAGCVASDRSASRSVSGSAREESVAASQPVQASVSVNRTLAYLDGRPITVNDLLPDLLETAGGQALVDLLIDRAVRERLAERQLTIAAAEIESEKALLLESLSSDANQAQRLLDELRESRGLGEVRFAKLLERNASLRRLVADQVQVTEAAIRQAYRLGYGEKNEARLITVASLSQAAELVRRAREEKDVAGFVDLAIAFSTDSSRAQGGLLPPVSLEDATFPQAIRQALSTMQVGQVSDPVAIENGFAVLRLERKIAAPSVGYDDVKPMLTRSVRVQLQRMAMQRLAREILQQSSPAVTDAALDRSFLWQKRAIVGPPTGQTP